MDAIWIIVILFSLPIGLVLVFFPHTIVRMRAKIQKGTFRNFGMSDEQIDKSPFYKALFQEDYSKRLEAQITDPKKFRSLIFLTRSIGVFILFFVVIDLCLLILALLTRT